MFRCGQNHGGNDTLFANMFSGAREYPEELPTEEVRERWKYVYEHGDKVIEDTKKSVLKT